ncbi:IS3 family transposase [Micromonospora soli]|uniref:IS3 family transposase n=1 Tax=Micromonospora sp. NBRC 110009 TaxID=3061627 RepID=UPI0026725CB6|nr:IS3 family transposase [Micromonospora sp. NBRC 110009]WKT97622.1 IS3 family transposase [Micromonospora sp. NBRC 110009]WKT98553.1 IS3 family transposase [Micromonospora sp. NBRC 110009]WKT98702.1 IS3 family transposase [Micromonospora sp. NBRC 110009]WKT99910.1 IS3 family transposase [Micromonospora sp. NBRC 110009]
MVNKHYPAEFKADAVALYRSRPGATIAQIADDLGVNRETLRSWVRADDQRRGAAAGPAAPPASGSVEDENAALRRRVRELEEERDILRKAARYFAGGDALVNRFQFVADHQQRYGVKRLCQILGVSRSSFYYWRSAAEARAARQAADVALASRIRAVHAEHDGTYGAPRITAELRDAGQLVNRKRVARVMRRFGVQGLRLRRRTRTTVPDPAAAKAPDLIGRHFTAPAPNQRYVGDITYLPVGDRGFLYLATVLDLHSRRLAGWAIADHMRTDLVIDALHAAQRTRGSLDGAIMHTDHGAQYTSRAFAAACTTAGVRQSMSAVGSSADNAAAESFNATFKRETLQGRRAFTDKREARLAAFRWLHRYNTIRRHSRLGQQSPITYEKNTRPAPATLAPAA